MRYLDSMLAVLLVVVGCDADVVKDKIHRDVAGDAVKQYEIAKKNGSDIDACVQAGFVAAAFLQAKDEANYAKWKATEKSDCAKAGLDR